MQTPTPVARSQYGFTQSTNASEGRRVETGKILWAIGVFRGDGIARETSNGCATALRVLSRAHRCFRERRVHSMDEIDLTLTTRARRSVDDDASDDAFCCLSDRLEL